MDIKLNTNQVNIALKSNSGVGTKNHSLLTNLDYEHSGHTGFASASQIQELLDLLKDKQDTLTAGDNISIVDNIISATGLTKNEIYIGPDEPTDPNIKIWIDTNEVAEEFYTKEEIDAKGFATETWVTAQGYLKEHQDLSEYAKKTDIPSLDGYATETWVENKGYLTEHQDISNLATKEEVTEVENKIPAKVSQLENDKGYLTEHQSLDEYAKKTDIPDEYIKSAVVDGNKLTLTNKDDSTVDFEPAGGGSSYTFTNGLTETDGTVSWDLSDRIKAGKNQYADYGGVIIGWKDSYNKLYATNKGAIACGHGYIMATAIGSLAMGYGSNGSLTAANEGSLAIGRFEQGKIGNYGAGSIICGNVGYSGLIQNYSNSNGSMCCGISDFSSYGSQMGNLTNTGQGALVVGLGVQNKGWGSTVLGMANIVSTTGTYNTRGDYAFTIGNGTSNSARSNAYTLDWSGNGTFAGTVSSSSGADYAEYFEWKDGNPNNEDRVGYIVCLDGDKIVKANTGDDILGICSGTAMVLGDSAEWNWNKRYLTDDFGRIIYEDYDVDYKEEDGTISKRHVHAPKQNPSYDPSKAYTKRSERPEWQIVGMMGKLYVRDDGSCVVNGYADVKDGIATKSSSKTNMRVMERVTDNIVRVLMK